MQNKENKNEKLLSKLVEKVVLSDEILLESTVVLDVEIVEESVLVITIFEVVVVDIVDEMKLVWDA